MKLPESRSVWEAALQLAIFRGEFFTALEEMGEDEEEGEDK